MTAPEAQNSLDASCRRRLYYGVELKVVAHGDESLTITWLVDLEIQESSLGNRRNVKTFLP